MVYLDNAATTKPIGELTNNWFNSNSSYSNGNEIIWECKKTIAECIKVKPTEIFFTSGGCEGNRICIDTLYSYLNRPVLISKFEHKSVYTNNKAIPSNNPEYCMFINNETGYKFDISNCLGSDMVQALGKEYIDCSNLLCATFSGHKIHSYKGIGFIYISESIQKYMPDISRTMDLDKIIHITGRVKNVTENLTQHRDKIIQLRKLLFSELDKMGIDYKVNCDRIDSSIISLVINELGEYVCNRLQEKEIYISTGSACNTGKGSYVLENMGLSKYERDRVIRVSLDSENSMGDIREFVRELRGERVGEENLLNNTYT